MKNIVTVLARLDRSQAALGGISNAQQSIRLTYEVESETGHASLVKIDGRRLADDPFAKPMRKPNAYESIIRDIETASMSWLPAVLTKVIRECDKKNVFKEGGLLEFVRSKLAPTGL